VSVEVSPARSEPRLSGRARLGIVVVLVSLTAMWVAILVIRLTDDNPDVLDDAAATATAGQICDATRATLPVVPSGRFAESPAVRADRLDAETGALTAMVAQLAAVPFTTDHDRRLVDQWLGDWRQHLADRTVYAESVRTTGRNDVVFNGAAPDRESITYRMDAFAARNGLSTCETLPDPRVTGA
jgi:hypothetical protein